MRPTLFVIDLNAPVAFAVLALVVLGVVIWLARLRRAGGWTTDHLYVGIALVGITAVVLALLLKLGRGHLEIKSYGAMLMVGFIAGTAAAIRLGRRRGIPAERLLDLGLVILVGAIVGARIAYVLITPGEPLLNIQHVLRYGLGGLSFHGGLIGGFLTASIYIVYAKLNFLRVTDAVAPAVAVGYAITRLGCFLNGCCFGQEAHVPWAMKFPFSPEVFAHDHFVHPTQLYASAMGLCMFGILLLLARGQSLGRAGRVFMSLLMLEGVERFVMEIYRYPASTHLLTAAQYMSLALFAIGVAGWFLVPKRPAVLDAPAPAEAVKA